MTEDEREKYENLLCEGSWFASLPADLRERLLQRSTVCSVPKGGLIVLEDNEAQGLFAVLEGQIAFVRTSGERETTIYVTSTGMWFGELALLLGTTSVLSARAHTNCVVLALPRAEFEAMVEGDRETYSWFAQLGLERYSKVIEVFRRQHEVDAGGRLCKKLADLAELRQKTNPNESCIELELAGAELALLVGVPHEAAQEALDELEERGVISQNFGRIRILELSRLRDNLKISERGQRERRRNTWVASFEQG